MSLTTINRKNLEDRRRQEIQSAAKKLFYTRTFSGTSMEAVAKEAGISKGLIYHYFESKEELLLSFSSEIAKYFRELEEMESPLDALRRFGEDFLVNDEKKYGQTPPTQILLTTFASVEVDVRKYREYDLIRKDLGRDYLGKFFQRGMEAGIFRDGDPRRYGDIYWSYLLGKLLPIKKGNESGTPESYVQEILELFLADRV